VSDIGDGNKLGSFAMVSDISQRKRNEEQLEKAKLESDKANQSKSEFLANMSHELRTPLNGVIGFTQILEKQLSKILSDKQIKFFKTIRSSGDHLLEMVNDILDLSKIEAGKIELDLKPFDFGKMLDRSTGVIKEIAHKKNLQIEKNIQSDLGWINGDETRLKQVIYNLLSNALKFTESGKKIGLDATLKEDNFIVTVWDEGEGMPGDSLEKIFDPFEQVKGSNKSKEKGTGLGLAISKRLLELHQGTIIVTSKLKEGSRFVITLPGRILIEDQNAEESVLRQGDMQPELKKHAKILVTEDNKENRELIEAALEDYQLDFAVSGEAAVNMASEKKYELILMDIQLPGISGIESMQQIRRNKENNIPVIALTAFAMKGDKEKYLDQGFDDYISKPINIAGLIQKIENILD
jgi:CheY-like chemotaxis protein/nitrogen-specific signal transduction histidine kinase